jgi:hypothetical protein
MKNQALGIFLIFMSLIIFFFRRQIANYNYSIYSLLNRNKPVEAKKRAQYLYNIALIIGSIVLIITGIILIIC